MPIEDWIEKWTQMCTREMDSAEKRNIERTESIERHHGERMDRIESSIITLDKKMDKSIGEVNNKIDDLSNRFDAKFDALAELIKQNNDSAKDRDNAHEIGITVINTRFAFYAAVAVIICSAAFGAFFSWILPEMMK